MAGKQTSYKHIFSRNTSRTLLMHIFFFFFFLLLPGLVFERMPGESVLTVTNVILQDTVANFFLLCFFYLNYYLLLPKYFFEKKYFVYVLYVITFLFVILPLPHLIAHWIGPGGGPDPGFEPGSFRGTPGSFPVHKGPPPGTGRSAGGDSPFSKTTPIPLFSFSLDELRRHLYLFFTALFFSFLLKIREHLAKLKEDKLSAELSTLKAQINPHFLFNTLNTIYALSIKKDDRASDAIVHLSGLMRYVTKDVHAHTIPLQKELEYITNYIELQKARLGSTVKIHFAVFGEAGQMRISPLMLITYIENAFKYGVNPDVPDCQIRIHIDLTKNGILLRAVNKKVSRQNNEDSTGIGLKNTAERLKYLYPQHHFLEIIENERDYSVILSIDLI